MIVNPEGESHGFLPDLSEENNLLAMLNLYLHFRDNYNCVSRNFLKHLYRRLSNFEFGYSNFKVLLTLENMRFDEFTDRLILNPTASRVFEYETRTGQESGSYLGKGATTTGKTQVSKRTSLGKVNSDNRSILELLRNEEATLANKEIKVMLTRLNVHTLEKQRERLPLLEFERISNPKLVSRVITICVSGFTSQHDAKE